MKVIIAGSRELYNVDIDSIVKESTFNVTEVVSGRARGIDSAGEEWANDNNIPIKPFPAEWDKYGRYNAGKIRNQQMANYADALIAIWDGESNGTRDMILKARKNDLKVFVKKIFQDNEF